MPQKRNSKGQYVSDKVLVNCANCGKEKEVG